MLPRSRAADLKMLCTIPTSGLSWVRREYARPSMWRP